MTTWLVQFMLIDHLRVVGAVVTATCVALKIYIVHNCPSHPCYRVSPLFTRRGGSDGQ